MSNKIMPNLANAIGQLGNVLKKELPEGLAKINYPMASSIIQKYNPKAIHDVMRFARGANQAIQELR